MPYVMVMGSLSAPHLSKDEGATVYGLKSEERASLVRVNNVLNHLSIGYSNFFRNILCFRYAKIPLKSTFLLI